MKQGVNLLGAGFVVRSNPTNFEQMRQAHQHQQTIQQGNGCQQFTRYIQEQDHVTSESSV
jgi:hypothetical protein